MIQNNIYNNEFMDTFDKKTVILYSVMICVL